MKSFAVYTVMVGKYGEIYQPKVIDDRFDYIIFSNDFYGEVGVWQVRHFPSVCENDNKRLSRYPKTHPVPLLNEYMASLYIDANIQILDSWVYERFLQLYNSKNVNIAGIKLVLSGRDCIYDHSYDICVRGIEHDYNAIRQMHALRQRGYPEHWGLNENNLIWRRHNDIVKEVDDEWWWWITHYSYRDQFSYMYCLWKYCIEQHFYLPIGEDTTNSLHFNRIHHDNNPEVSKIKKIKFGLCEYIRNICRTIDDNSYRNQCKQWVFISKLPFPRLSLFVFGFISLIIYFPKLLWVKCLVRSYYKINNKYSIIK